MFIIFNIVTSDSMAATTFKWSDMSHCMDLEAFLAQLQM